MTEIAQGIHLIDTELGGKKGLTSAYLVEGAQPALIDPGAETSADLLIADLHRRGLRADDLAWIVLTHIHLDHCGGTGALAAAFPRAQVIVHERGARHLAEPERLVAASHDVYAHTAPIYGGLSATPADRITVAPDGFRVDLGSGGVLEMIATPGHARHHMSVLHDRTGALIIGDAAGTGLPDSNLYVNLPPADVDIEGGRDSLRRLRERAPELITLSHFGPTADPEITLAIADEGFAQAGEAARTGYARGGRAGIAEELERVLPFAATISHAPAVELWQWLGWDTNNVLGLEIWAQRQAENGQTTQ